MFLSSQTYPSQNQAHQPKFPNQPNQPHQYRIVQQQDTEGRPGRGALQLARRKLRLVDFQRRLRDAVELDADELAKLRQTARPVYQQVGWVG